MADQISNAQDLSEQEQIRREKLKALQEAGKDPYRITRFEVTHHSEEIRNGFDALEGREVSLVSCPNGLWVRLPSVMYRICRG